MSSGDAAVLLKHFVGQNPFRLLTNNPKKLEDLAAHGVKKVIQEKHVHGVVDTNRNYLEAKRGWGHVLQDDDIKV